MAGCNVADVAVAPVQLSTNPYKSSAPGLLLSVVAYVDVLGYGDMVRERRSRSEDLDLLARLHEALRRSRQWLDGRPSGNSAREAEEKDLHSLVAFTDNIVIGWPVVPHSLPEIEPDPIMDDAESQLGLAFMGLAGFQLEMANAGFFVRGAVAVGDAYVDEYCVFGKGLLEAYEGESSQARDPRIVLASSARDRVAGHLEYYARSAGAPQNRELLRDVDGQWFLNYLDAIHIAGDDQPFLDELRKHKASVEARLNEFRQRPTVFAKYSWVAGYHNFFCGRHGYGDCEIEVGEFEGSRGFIVDDRSRAVRRVEDTWNRGAGPAER